MFTQTAVNSFPHYSALKKKQYSKHLWCECLRASPYHCSAQTTKHEAWTVQQRAKFWKILRTQTKIYRITPLYIAIVIATRTLACMLVILRSVSAHQSTKALCLVHQLLSIQWSEIYLRVIHCGAMSRSVSWRRLRTDAMAARIDEALQSTMYLVNQTGPTGFLIKQDSSEKKIKVSTL